MRASTSSSTSTHGGASQNMLSLLSTTRCDSNDHLLSHSHPAARCCCLPPRDSSAPYLAMPGEYEEALRCLSSLITRHAGGDGANRGEQFDLMFHYLKILDLEDAISRLKVIRVAGTKGKGSTCTFTELILRYCGFRTGLFTSPHLIDVRERFRLDGSMLLLWKLVEENLMQRMW